MFWRKKTEDTTILWIFKLQVLHSIYKNLTARGVAVSICPSKIFASHQLEIWFSHASAIINFTWGTWKIMALTVDFALMKNESNLPELSLERCSVISIRCSLFIVCWIIHFSRDVIPSLSRDVPMLLLIYEILHPRISNWEKMLRRSLMSSLQKSSLNVWFWIWLKVPCPVYICRIVLLYYYL